MIKNIVFDMGNVILKYDPNYIVDHITQDQDLKEMLHERVFNSPEWIQLDQGLITLNDAKNSMSKDLSKEQIQLVHYTMDHWYDYMNEVEGMKIILRTLKERGYNLYLLSNASLAFYDYYPKYSSFKFFNGFYISAKHKFIKPDPKIYQSFFNAFHLNAQECIFIDDRKENVDGSMACGMDAIIFDGDLEKLILILKERKIL